MNTTQNEKRSRLPRITEMAHQLLAARIQRGDIVVDATAGNGHDTLFLAELVGDMGQVHAYDVQIDAIKTTGERLMTQGYENRVTLHHDSHTAIRELDDALQAVIFNLGYLPGSDKTVITKADDTIAAVEEALLHLRSGGIVVLVVYVGHTGGEAEAKALEAYVRALPVRDYLVLKYEYINPDNRPPYIIAIEKK
ncbi:tRNA (mnm(5)s(2)U34)-methyltransferase [Aneurinibacillus sp. REN35]|uniref:tRNA (mnm(5)s(2)U34)-methyltransferase n=1 Tax=Aneurinibacillus sp. REN35 TaxID=3237286 RepID=UPI003528E2DB